MPTAPPAPEPRRVVLVTGAPRSGTSTVAGTLHHLGLHLPLPVLKGNESNPRGFFESWWPVHFHRRLMKRAGIEQTDARPQAAEAVRGAVNDAARRNLHTWLSGVVEASDRVVIKDPRAAWLPALWVDTASEVGAELGILIMVRHPSAVVGSRSTYYAKFRPHLSEWQYSVWSLAGWINQNLSVERETRGRRRTVVRYRDLVQDWRPVMAQVARDLDVRLDLTPGVEAEVDGFIEPSLERHTAQWSVDDLPEDLVSIAEDLHEAMSRLADPGGDAGAEAALDEVSARYSRLYSVSTAIAQDVATAQGRSQREAGRREGRRQAPAPSPATSQASGAARVRAAYRTVGRTILRRVPGARRIRDGVRARRTSP